MENEQLDKDALHNIKLIAESISLLNEQAYALYLPMVEELIHSNSKNEHQIEFLLDGIIEIACTKKGLILYKKLCRYYWDINQEATADYINYYRERWDSESLNEENN
jgi:hypothetical protein